MASRIILIFILFIGCNSEDEEMRLFISSLSDQETATPRVYYNYPSAIHSLALEEEVADNVINVSHDATFNYLRDILLAITDSSELNTYRVNVANGTYEGIDYQVPDYVMVVGESKAGVIINADGNSTWVADANYPFPTEIGKPINTINQAYTHSFWIANNSVVKNCTITGTRIKYNSHQDTSLANNTHSIFSNCHFIKTETNATDSYYYNIGCGGRRGTIMSWWDCTFELRLQTPATSLTKNSGVFWHNDASEPAIAVAEILDCNAIDQGGIIVTEQNSSQNDIVIVNGYTVSGYITWGAIWYGLNTLNNVNFQISNTELIYTEY